jgi:5-methylcytosine-specific restriction protein A
VSRANFSKPTKRAALARSGGLCEASGPFYGLPEGQRCNLPLAHGVEFDHFDLDANSKDNSLENCRAVCPKCHGFKTRNIDIPKAAKTVRQQDRANGIVKPQGRLRGPGFAKSEKTPRIVKTALPPRPMFEDVK